jgi:flagellar basal body rod protein FlgG
MTDQPFHFAITSNGGARNNGSTDAHGYGSYHIQTQDGREALVRLDSG